MSITSKQTRTYPVEITVTVDETSSAVFHGENAKALADEYVTFKSQAAEDGK